MIRTGCLILVGALSTFQGALAEESPADAGPSLPGNGMTMQGLYGPYPMEREASGTAWEPDATPMQGVHEMGDTWITMWHGFVNSIYDHQGGPRGANESFSSSMLMFMGERALGPGTWGIRLMGSLDPTMGKAGYPLLFATGETADGKTPLIDRQHPHNLVMEAATSYSMPLGAQASVFTYVGLPGEPALGPPVFMHRFTGEDNPEAPITHHWLDSTHITNGVATVGLVWNGFKLEGSTFNGHEPDQYRYDVETRSFDSWSTRLSWNPDPHWAFQVSQGRLASPEQLEPQVAVMRDTASAIYQTELETMPFGVTLAWGQDRRSPGVSTNAVLLESTIQIRPRYTVFARAEWLGNDELFAPGEPEAGEVFKVGKLSIGAIDDFYKVGPVAFGVGALVSRYAHAAALDASYGHPSSWMIFLRAKLNA